MKPTLTTLSVRYVLNLLEAARRRGLNGEEMCGAAGIQPPGSDDPSERYLTAEYLALWRVIMARLNDPSFPLDVARVSAPETSDVVGFAFATSETLGAGFERLAKYLVVMTDGARWVLEESAHEAKLALVRPHVFVPEHRFADEFALGHIVEWGRVLARTSWAPTRVRFRHPAPDLRAQKVFENHFCCPLEFGCERAELVLAPELLGLPLTKADSAIAGFFDRHIEALIERTYPGRTFVQEVRTAIIEAFSCQQCSMPEIAKRLGTSPRTLNRRLAAEGVNFKRLLDEIRAELARSYLEDRRLSLGEIAFILGYAEPSAFHHAFRRWTGMTPAQFRAGATLSNQANGKALKSRTSKAAVGNG